MHNRRPLRLASTIGPIETGLLPTLEAAFSRQTAIPIEHVALGTGAALERAKRGGIDLVIAHAPALEEQFVAEGWALGRHAFAANDFLLVGPLTTPRVRAALATCWRRSGASPRLQRCFSRAAIDPARTQGARAVGGGRAPTRRWRLVPHCPGGMAGSAATAREAAEQHAYTLLDRATFITARPALEIVAEGDPRLLNVLSALPIDPRRAADVNEGGAEAFLNWLLGQDAQTLIGDFGQAEHGTALFLRRDQIPSATA